jgi:hypothetical protein
MTDTGEPRPGAKDGQDTKRQPGATGAAGEPGAASGQVKPGPIQVLPDDDRLAALPPGGVDATLDRLARDIAARRRQHWRRAAAPPGNVKAW